MTSINIEQSNDILAAVRDFYRWGFKTSNKRYGFEDETWKNIRRTVGVSVADCALSEIRPFLNSLSYLEKGKYIFDHEVDYGNCGEMLCLAGYLVTERHPEVEVYVVGLIDPPEQLSDEVRIGDHGFISVNRKLEGSSLSNLSENGSIIIDPWLNFCCEASSYEIYAMDKLTKWESQGKQIEFDLEWMSPTATVFTRSLMECQFVSHNFRERY